MYPPDNVDRSRASANCAGSYLHSTWWSAQNAYATTSPLHGLLNGVANGGLMGGLGGQSLGQLGNSLGSPFGEP